MILSPSSALWVCFAIIIVKAFVWLVRHERIKRQMPPGPPTLPFLGNVLQLRGLPWLRFTEWAQQYGPIFSLDIAGQPMVVLNDFTVTADLTDRRSGIYSDRPRLILAGELMAKNLALPIAPYGNLWRDMRKATHESFNIHVVKRYRGLQEQAVHKFLVTIFAKSQEWGWERDFEDSFAKTALSITYALTLEEAQQRKDIVHYIDAFTTRFAVAATPGNSLIDLLPFLERIPHKLNPWKTHGEKLFQSDTEVLVGFLNEVRHRMAAGLAPKSFCSDLIEAVDRGELTDVQAAWLCGLILVAGVETTGGTLRVFILAMILYPEVMKRAQIEIDQVVGRDRLPTFEDAVDLPYVDALICEVLRWCPVTPMAIGKRATQDDFYEGYFIPKGTLILQNVWAMNHDTAYFDEPDVFKPERYLDAEGRRKEPIPDTHGHDHGTFGSGRRICVGRDLAQQALFIYIATVLWAADISRSADETAVLPSPTTLEDRGLVARPFAFPCVIAPRSPDVERILALDALREEP